MKNILKRITSFGTSQAGTRTEKRNIILCNYLSLVITLSPLVLMAARITIGAVVSPSETFLILFWSFIFLVPLILNSVGITTLSRFVLCWIPPVAVMIVTISGLMKDEQIETTSFVGIRFFLLGFSCIPFLVFSLKSSVSLIASLSVPVFCLLLFDPLLNLFHVGYKQMGFTDPTYGFNNVRAGISLLIIGFSFYFLKRLVENGDERNDLLVAELENKSKLIQKTSEEKIWLSEAKFRGAFENSAIGMSLVSLEGKWLKVNRQLCNMVGYSEEELLSCTFMDITHPEDVERDLALYGKCLRGELETYQVEKRYYHKNGSILWINLNVALIRNDQGSPMYSVSQIENITGRKNAEVEKEKASYLLNERVKELTTLHRCSQLLQFETKPMHEVMHELVNILPAGWQYPEITAARIVIGEQEFKTRNFLKSVYSQKSEFRTPDKLASSIEVLYLQEKPTEMEGPFLAEERRVLDIVTEMLRVYFTRKYEADVLKKSQANLDATINNTTFLVWSVSRKYEVTNFNKPFEEFIQEHYGLAVKVGARVVGDRPDTELLRARWVNRYNRALSGELFKVIDQIDNQHLEFSLNPIIEDNRVIGVSIFGEDISERLQHQKQMADANKKLGEARLMALRSVMNPHFLFNALNSIQFFIAQNDRKNAINYLSTFSKLMRGVLNSSVQSKIKLSDEIELLKHYVNLELVRFENKFEFVVNIDSLMDIDDIEIPSLLIQPFIENAILHGLYNKQGKGLLIMTVSEDKEAVCFQIEDNGIGRKAAWELRRLNNPSHKSVAMELTEERLKLINAQNNVSYQVIDLHTEDGLVAGTKVLIWVRP